MSNSTLQTRADRLRATFEANARTLYRDGDITEDELQGKFEDIEAEYCVYCDAEGLSS